jgi:NADPH:quinone reductase-like Zn-dependent oxidoreductase
VNANGQTAVLEGGDTRATMKAIVRYRYGSPDLPELRNIEKPEIADDEVLVRVRAAGVDRGVWHVMTGLPYPIRLAGFGFRAPKNPVIGSDVAGVVEAIGKDVGGFRPGDEVFGIGKGSYAEYAPALEAKLAPKPSNLTFEQAAAVAISGSTALQAVRDHGKVRQGQEVLIIGASGGVGTYAVQIAKVFGAHVAGEGKGRWLGGTDRQLRATMLSPFVGQKLGTFINKETHEYLLALKDLIESHKVTPVIDKTYPLVEVPEAIR